MSDELKPCPFCGERPRLTLRPDNAEGTAYFAAVACYCGGYSACAHKMATATNADEAEGKVHAAWNRRAAAQPPAAMPAAELEALAREAGLQRDGDNWYSVGPTKYDEHDVSTADLARFAALVLAQAQSVPATGAQPEPTRADLVAALAFYADGLHFDKGSPDAWDTVSGEPQNWWCDEAGTATVEDGSIAKMTLAGELTAAQIEAIEDGEEFGPSPTAPTGSAG